MNHFCLLKDPRSYVCDDWDLLADEQAREYWLKHFEQGFQRAMEQASMQGRDGGKRITAARSAFEKSILGLREDAAGASGGQLTVITLDRLRQQVLQQHGLDDPYAVLKNQATAAATQLYPQVVRELHLMADPEKWLHLVQCVFAGNLYDVGSADEVDLPDEADDFLATLDNLKPRPWLVDDYDTLAGDLMVLPPTWTKAVVFVDNAGSDFVLGVMPLVRELALKGVVVVLAANERPSLNDITIEEMINTVERLAGMDGELAALIQAGMLEVVSTGSGLPLLDLAEVSDELNEAAADADLVVLEGQGRAIESNFNAEFKVDSLRLAMVKNPTVAKRIGGQTYDCVCKYVQVD